MKALTIVGNRPQFIKAAPLALALARAGVEEVSLHSGQHYDPELSEIFYEELGIAAPRYSLDLRSADTALMQPAIRDVVARERPDWVIVFGDTNTTLAGAQAAVQERIPVAHVEAGLRSGDLSMPEERNRIEVDRISALLLLPTEKAVETLRREAVVGTISVVGDVMADASRIFTPIAKRRHPSPHPPGSYLVATVHREANVGRARLARIVEGLNRLDSTIVFPLHPRTRNALQQQGLSLGPHVDARAPVGYLEMTSLVASARAVLTDSGGLQKEAYWNGVPCITMRPSTEWIETLEVGANILVDDDPDAIVAAVTAARMPETRPPLYGDGHASDRVARALLARIPRS